MKICQNYQANPTNNSNQKKVSLSEKVLTAAQKIEKGVKAFFNETVLGCPRNQEVANIHSKAQKLRVDFWNNQTTTKI